MGTVWMIITNAIATAWDAVATFLNDHPAAVVTITFVLIALVVHWWTTPSWDSSEDDDHCHS